MKPPVISTRAGTTRESSRAYAVRVAGDSPINRRKEAVVALDSEW